jgi:undecaprenyl diphosphate synthase
MTQFDEFDNLPRHVAIIMDGNGRWAQHRGLRRTVGHRHGVEAVRRVTRAARDFGIEYLTLFSFSTENWTRPKSEVSELFTLLKLFIRKDLAELHQNNVKVVVIGEREGLPGDILSLLVEAERLTEDNSSQTLVIAFNYGARLEIASAAAKIAAEAARGEIDPKKITPEVFERYLLTAGIPDPDLVIRTSGEKRLSNFLVWQTAYSEFVFTDTLWPDFTAKEFADAIREYCARRRRFGGTDGNRSRDTGS